MKKYTFFSGLLAIMVSGLLASCAADSELLSVPETASTTFNVGLDKLTRAGQPFDKQVYDAKMYLYEGRNEADGTISYAFKQQFILEDSKLEVKELNTKSQYKAVFMARTKDETPELPNLIGLDTNPGYKEATADYIVAQTTETEKNIFRSVLTFTPNANNSVFSTMLTRQNGALEVRIKNVPNMESVTLHVNGHTTMHLHDGTGGQVITVGEPTQLSKTVTEGLTASEVRVKINLLPQEDITENHTDATGQTNYLEIVTLNNGTRETKRYPLKVKDNPIPIYSNQVTWLTLGNGSGDFTVAFSGNINLDDDNWDGWIENF